MGLPTHRSLWFLVDLYGNTYSATFFTTDDVPREIIAQGSRAVEAYELACARGSQPVRRTRLMLLGQEKAGKTSLKRALTGQCHNSREEKTDGIDVSSSCAFNVGENKASWKLKVKGEETARRERLEASVDLGVLGGAESLAEERDQAVATNLALEVLTKLRQEPGSRPDFRDAQALDTGSSSVGSSSSTKDIFVVSSDESSPLFTTPIATGIPPHIARTVAEILQRKQEEDRQKSTLSLLSSCIDPNNHGDIEGKIGKTSDVVPRQEQGYDTDGVCGEGDDSSDIQSNNSGDDTVVLSIWDFAGQAAYYTTHQVFLTSRAIYCIVFNLCDNLGTVRDQPQEKMGTLQYLDFWMRSIHAHAAENRRNDVANTTLSPPIFLVGTHREKLGADAESVSNRVEEKRALLEEFLVGKPYAQHVVLPLFAVENNTGGLEDAEIARLREELQRVASRQSYIGEHIPSKWLGFEQDITAQADMGVNFATYNQVTEVAANHSITKREEVSALLQFYHDLGTLVHYSNNSSNSGSSIGIGSGDNNSYGSDVPVSNMVVLNPQWLIHMFSEITTRSPLKEKWGVLADKWTQLLSHGVLEESLLPSIWPDTPDDHRAFLLSLMARFDLLCPRLLPAGQSHRYPGHSWYIPMRFSPVKDKKKVFAQSSHDVFFFIDFNGFLPEGLFHRLQARTILWSQERGGRDLSLHQGLVRVFVDSDHDLALEVCPPHLHRVKVLVMHVKEKEATSSKRNSSPAPETVARVRNFLETSLDELRQRWMKRLAYKFCFLCPCRRVCELHQAEACSDQDCVHFLDLDECLTSQVVCCEHRRVKTESFKKWFPSAHSKELKEPVIGPVLIEQSFGNIERHMPNLPSWLKGAAKLLNGAPDNQDWVALAKTMGYKQARIDSLNEDLNPSLALLTDWIVSSGNTTMSVDVLLHYLKQLGCDDVAEIILQAKEHDLERPQVFLSYQWDVQDQVTALRDHLEKSGFSCWMDIGQMGGGDQLSTKIDQGLRGCKLVVACVTPKYTASHLCNRELWLADMLHKPILPVVMETVGWPPPGGMAVILSQLVHIDMKGVGGHGGTGIHADLKDKYSEIVQRISLHIQPDLVPCVDATLLPPPPTTFSSSQAPSESQRLSDRFSGYRTSMSSLSEVDFEGRSGTHHYQRHGQFNPQHPRDASMDVMLSRYEDISAGGDGESRARVGLDPHAEEQGAGARSGRHNSSSSFSTRGVPQANVKQCAICSIL